MGEIRVKVKLQNKDDIVLQQRGIIPENQIRQEEIEMLVDTGAVMMLLPQDLVEKLGLELYDKVIVTLANEQKIELLKAGHFWLTVCNRRMVSACLVGPPGCEPLLGQLVLEELDLLPDPLKKNLTPRPESPYLPTLKMK